eukprot:Nk52_evm6s554 gene=Nk52_evmTU6s554
MSNILAQSEGFVFRTLNAEDEMKEWIRQLVSAFAEKGAKNGQSSQTMKEYFVNHWQNDPWKDEKMVFLAVTKTDQKIVGCVRIHKRRVFLNSKIVQCGCIGEVSTIPEYRGMGLASALLKLAIKCMVNNGFEISMLSSAEQHGPYYEKFGWKHVPVPLESFSVTSEIMNSLIHTNEVKKGYELSEIDIEADWKILMEMYLKQAAAFNGCVVRDSEAYWKNWIAFEMERQKCKGFKLQSESGALQSYAFFRCEDDSIQIFEFLSTNRDTFEGSIHFILLLERFIAGLNGMPDLISVLFQKNIMPKKLLGIIECATVPLHGQKMYQMIKPELEDTLEKILGGENGDAQAFFKMDSF